MSLGLGVLLTGMLGGLALFLYGMDQLSVGLKSVAGARMKSVLSRITENRFKSAFAGAFITSIIQSSSITTVLVVGFVSAGLLSLQQSIGVIMGANIGATVTAQIVAFKVTQYALIVVAVGAGMYLFSKREKIRQLGMVLLGLGLIFFGIDLMSRATDPLRVYEPFVEAMRTMDSPLRGILVGAVFTAIIQSSSATTGVIIVLAGQGFITLEAGIALAFGANIGTCVTAVIASIGKREEAIRASVVHVLFNVMGVVLWYAFIPDLAELVRVISPSAVGLTGADRLAAETPRQIANAHTLFNVANTLLFIGFVGPLARLVTWMVPDRGESDDPVLKARYLDDSLLDSPDLALDRVHRELLRIGKRSLKMVNRAGPLVVSGTQAELKDLAGSDEEVDALHRQIVRYLGALSTRTLGSRQSDLSTLFLHVNNHLESIADMIATNLVESGVKREEEGVEFSPETRDKILLLHDFVVRNLEETLDALSGMDAARARAVVEAKAHVTELTSELDVHLSTRLTADAAGRVTLFRLESEVVEYLKRIYYFTKRIARETIRYTEESSR